MDSVLNIALIGLVAVVIWLVVEVIMTVRKVRPTVASAQKALDDLQPVIANVNDAVEKAKPVIVRLDTTLEQAQPAVQQVEPLLVQTVDAIGALSGDLHRIDGILGDVSRATNAAGTAVVAVNDAAGNIASKARGVFGRGKATATNLPAALEEPEVETQAASCDEPQEAVPEIEVARKETGYFTYPSN